MITRHRGEFQLRLMCRVLEVAPSGYYAWRKRSPSLRALADEVLMARVRCVHEESGNTYGAPRVQRELKAQGAAISTKRVARLMREDGLVARAPKWRRADVGETVSVSGFPCSISLIRSRVPLARIR